MQRLRFKEDFIQLKDFISFVNTFHHKVRKNRWWQDFCQTFM